MDHNVARLNTALEQTSNRLAKAEKERDVALANARYQREMRDVMEGKAAALVQERDALKAELDATHEHLILTLLAVEFIAEHFNLDMKSLNYGGVEAEMAACNLHAARQLVGMLKDSVAPDTEDGTS